jgi:hypothetical protein
MSFENDLHDWYIDGIMLTPSEVTLFVYFYEARRKIRLGGATRCLLNDFLISNIIYEAKIISAHEEPELYQAEVARLDASYPAKWSGTAPKILSISASVGMQGAIEFRDLEVIDLS